jgi:aminopeptidase-like protein
VASDPATTLDALFDRLFPIGRSITGPGFRESLRILCEVVPFERRSVESGTRVFDWTVPPEWHIRGARLTAPDGEVLADWASSSLSVVSFSTPVDRTLSLQELRPHLHSIPRLPEAVPYVTSYYQRNWGFCLPHRVVARLVDGPYHARIDSELVEGELDYGEAVLPGESAREVLLSSYLCHPSLANNELSGPLALVELYRRLAAWPRRRLSYRFVINPETIGSLVYLSVRGEHLRRHLAGGLVLTCLGGPSPRLSYKRTRRENTLLDELVAHLAERGELAADLRPFTPCSGSDERQYCSPGFDLPVGQMARTVYGEYDGYHNSLDTKEFMGIERLVESAAAIESLLKAFEYAGSFRNLSPYGEPHLASRNLYPNVNSEATRVLSNDQLADRRTALNRILTVLSYSDGEHTLLEIARRLDCSPAALAPVVDLLERERLLAPAEPAG